MKQWQITNIYNSNLPITQSKAIPLKDKLGAQNSLVYNEG